MSDNCKIFIGNLSYKCTTDDLYDHFGKYGKIEDAVVVTDRETGRSRGFGFVTYAEADDASDAIKGCHESDFMDRDITVREAESKRAGGGRGGGYGSGRRDNYGGGGGYGRGGGYRSGGRERRDDNGYRGNSGYGGGSYRNNQRGGEDRW